MTKRTVLITNLVVANRSGTEVAVEELADGLRRAGHRPMVYTLHVGAQAETMRRRGHVVVDRLAQVPWRPDVIHGHHTPSTMAAMLAFPEVPALFVCHDANAVHDIPPRHPSVRRWFAVSDRMRARLISEGIPPEEVGVLSNVVDLERYVRRAALPEVPARALVIAKTATLLETLRTVCAMRGLVLDEIGHGVGTVSDRLGAVLPDYDLVFATGRMALEAASVGCGVVVCDERGLAGFLTAATAERWLPGNFGGGTVVHHPSAAAIGEAMDRYDPAEIVAATTLIRERASLATRVGELEAIYTAMLAEPAPDPAAAAAAAAEFIEDWVPTADTSRPWAQMARAVGREELLRPSQATVLSERMETAIDALRDTKDDLAASLEQRLAARLDELAAQLRRLPSPPGPAERAERVVRGLYRRVLPHSLRAPVHRWRGHLHRWLDGA